MSEQVIELNQEQKNAVLQTEGPVLIIAGAGSGKTRVLTTKIALLIEKGVRPDEILALTFTKKAANEMKERIIGLAGSDANRVVMGTFHSVFIRFLRRHHDLIGFPENFTIYDEDDSISAIRSCIMETIYGPDWKERRKNMSKIESIQYKAMEKVYKPKTIRNKISSAKNELVGPKAYRLDRTRMNEDARHGRAKLADIFELYMKKCRNAAAMDFDDILFYMSYILENHRETARQIAGQFRYILVDEYQDTNQAQYNIIRHLAAEHRNICVVGDDSQSIYAFRGAKIQNIFNFRQDYPEMKTFKLECNYRSTPAIVNSANRLIAHNTNRLPKNCRAVKPEGDPIILKAVKDDRAEARLIADVIIAEVTRHGRKYDEFAVLYRTNAQSRALEDELVRCRIPYMIWSGTSFFQRTEIKDTIAYLKLTANSCDDESFKRICNTPSRGISEATLSKLEAAATAKECSIFEAATDPETLSQFKALTQARINAFTDLMQSFKAFSEKADAKETAEYILDKSGLYKFYHDQQGEDGLKRTNNIDEMLNGIQYFMDDVTEDYRNMNGTTEGMPKPGLLDYLEDISLLSNADSDRKNTNKNHVNLMTAHSAKGLEFPVVFIAGAEEGLFPLVHEGSDCDLEEERRLFYVAMTRAMDNLVITYCGDRYKYGEHTDAKASRFIDELNDIDDFPDEDFPEEDFPEDDFPEDDFPENDFPNNDNKFFN